MIFYYGIFEGVTEALAEKGIGLIHLCTWWDVLAEARATETFDADTLDEVERYLRDPKGWAPAHG